MSKKKEIGKTIEGRAILEMGWKNYAQVEESGEIVEKDNFSFSMSPYLFLREIDITHRSYTIEAYVNLNSVYHNGYHLTSPSDDCQDCVDGNKYEYFESGDHDAIYADKEVMELMKKHYDDIDFDVDDIESEYNDEWCIIKYFGDICFVGEEAEGIYNIVSTNESLENMFLSIYKAKSFVELDQSSFVSMDDIDKLYSLQRVESEKEDSNHIKRTDIAKLLDMDKDTLYKLDANIKKENCQKSLKKLDNYIDLYLLRKHLRFEA